MLQSRYGVPLIQLCSPLQVFPYPKLVPLIQLFSPLHLYGTNFLTQISAVKGYPTGNVRCKRWKTSVKLFLDWSICRKLSFLEQQMSISGCWINIMAVSPAQTKLRYAGCFLSSGDAFSGLNDFPTHTPNRGYCCKWTKGHINLLGWRGMTTDDCQKRSRALHLCTAMDSYHRGAAEVWGEDAEGAGWRPWAWRTLPPERCSTCS